MERAGRAAIAIIVGVMGILLTGCGGALITTNTPAPTSTLVATATPVLGAGSIWTRPADRMEMVYVPGGSFEMGSNDGGSDERPVHTVRLDGYWIDRTEVTNGMYALCVAAGACDPPEGSSSATHSSYYGNVQFEDYPVINVSWNDGVDYCTWAGGRLPTEAEWEYAARGEDGRAYPWGNASPSSVLLNYNTNVGDTTAVGSYPDGASPYGVLDMAGNVYEWVADWDGDYPSGSVSNPTGPSTGTYKVLRGGSWYYIEFSVRSASRFRNLPGNALDNIGFRCSRSP